MARPKKDVIQPEDKYVIRFPDGMRDKLKKAAKENNRSLNAEIIARLEMSVDLEREYSKLIAENKHYKKIYEDTYVQNLELKRNIEFHNIQFYQNLDEMEALKDEALGTYMLIKSAIKQFLQLNEGNSLDKSNIVDVDKALTSLIKSMGPTQEIPPSGVAKTSTGSDSKDD